MGDQIVKNRKVTPVDTSKDLVYRFANKSIPNLERTKAGLEPYSGAWGTVQILHFLRRTTFNPNLDNIAFLKNKTLKQSVELLLNSSSMPEPPVKHYTLDDTELAIGETWINAPYNYGINSGIINNQRKNSLRGWMVDLMLSEGINIREKMTLFWSNHFSTELNEYDDARSGYIINKICRENALGNFKSLVKQITLTPAMLRYLNGYLNSATAPDENYSRELQELFTLGKGPDSKYSEEDVKAAAKVLTGWRINNTVNPQATFYDNSRHDKTNKQFSSFYNNTIIVGKNSSTAGNDELDDLLNMIFAQEEVSKYICRRLYRWFIYYVIDNNAEENVIKPLAKIFRDNNYTIKPVLDALFNSAHFFEFVNIGCQIKNPADLFTTLINQFYVLQPLKIDVVTYYTVWVYYNELITFMGQKLMDPPDVAGWPAYWQSPQYYELWINSVTYPKRVQFSDSMISNNGITRGGFKIVIDPLILVNKLNNPSNPNSLVAELVEYLYPIEISNDQKNFLKNQTLLSGQSNDIYWSDAWNAYKSNPTNAATKKIVTDRLMSLLKYMMSGMSEYQLS
ncbi:MAG: DUF1800 domain-containing protein [Bacteroidetes bacterium]|nr:DUF1800 domain-containing protein [Bacteroidota bacterium]